MGRVSLELAEGEEERPQLDTDVVAILAQLDESNPLSEHLSALTKGVGMRDRELAALVGCSRATLARWRRSGEAERPDQIEDLRAIVSLLLRTGAMRPRSIAGWLRSRNRALAWRKPLEVLAEGDFALVLSAAESACGGRDTVVRNPSDAGGTRDESLAGV
jgi:hypothetical protein